MIPAPVEYLRASSLEEALEALGEPEAKALAGGQSLIPLMKLRLARPALVVDIGGLELRGVETGNGEIRLGSLTTWDELAGAAELRRPALAAIPECAGSVGDLQVRNLGTLGGGLAHADPASDMPAVVLALGARVHVRSAAGKRALAAADLFVGAFTTSLDPGELLVEVVVPKPPPGSGSAYVSVEHPASGFALAGAAALVRPDGSRSLALTGVASRPFLVPPGAELAEVLAKTEVLDDAFAPAQYRRHLAGVVAGRAVERAAARAREGGVDA